MKPSKDWIKPNSAVIRDRVFIYRKESVQQTNRHILSYI